MSSIQNLIEATATAHNISTTEALDEVFDALETCLGSEAAGREDLTASEAAAITEYIAEQYRTNRTRL